MKISLVNFFALLMAVVITACGETANTATDAADETTEAAAEDNAASAETVISGDNFEVVVTDGEASSPRKQLTGTAAGVAVTIDYGSPYVKGRTIWGDLVPYDKVWRTGANSATTIEFAGDVTVEGQALAAGKYALFTIPSMESWQVVFNTVTDQWGSGSYCYSSSQRRYGRKHGLHIGRRCCGPTLGKINGTFYRRCCTIIN